jgi:leucyl-tRNA synthetase
MDKFYDHQTIEKKWQQAWDKQAVFVATEKDDRKKFYALCMFPYPSSAGLHVGHPESYTAIDIVARFKRLRGYNVLNPMGWDAFGLPAENYAIKVGTPPWQTTASSIKNFTRQVKSFGFSYDWKREINTSDPSYYKWTQWLFLQLLKNGLAYKKKAKVNWCEHCQTVLANEQVVDNKCERCGFEVMQKDLEQWFFKITDYAEKLLQGLDTIDWPEHIKQAQRNWIGKSEGAEIDFRIKNEELSIKVFTTRPDTLYGATYMVLAPEHELVIDLESRISNLDEVKKYINATKKKTDIERTNLNKEKTGKQLKGVMAINPANGKEIPIFIADYVLSTYGTGAIMAVPAHDERDWEFAKKYNLEITSVIKSSVKRTALILHGNGGDGQKNWYPWLKKELEVRGYEVFTPNMPESDNPMSEKWLQALKSLIPYINKESIIIGHSLGCPTAIQFIEKNKLSVKKLILVAPTHPEMQWENIYQTHEKENARLIEQFTKVKVNWGLVKSYCQEVIGLFSDNDKYIPLSTKDLFERDLPGEYFTFKSKGHFNHSDKIFELPELIDLIFNQAEIENGKLFNSGEFNGLDSETAMKKITKKVGGIMKTQYRLRDWLVSRQRYWGAPIPIIYCETCGTVPVPEKDLPVLLPQDVDFKPTGQSPLVSSKEFHNIVCPTCGKLARRESDTMDTFVCSSWYFLRYCDPQNTVAIFDKEKVAQWLPVDIYIGGAEHAVLHLLYARFVTKALKDFKLLNIEEPFLQLRNQGMILGEDNQKMSKSRGNVINPDEVVAEYGADTMRIYEMFMGPLEDSKPWSTTSIIGAHRFLEKVWLVVAEWIASGKPSATSPELIKLFHKTFKKVTEDIINFKFNTAISAMMILVNQMAKEKSFTPDLINKFFIILSPFAPHIAEELWQKVGGQGFVCQQTWPSYDDNIARDEIVTIAIQINGKLRASIDINSDLEQADVLTQVRAQVNIKKYIKGKTVVKEIYIPGKIVNLVVKE